MIISHSLLAEYIRQSTVIKSIKLPGYSLKFMTSFNQDSTSIYFAQSENYYKKKKITK